jgi:hypothetical protein
LKNKPEPHRQTDKTEGRGEFIMSVLLPSRRALRLTMVVHEPKEVQTPAEQKVIIAVSIDSFSDTYARHVV